MFFGPGAGIHQDGHLTPAIVTVGAGRPTLVRLPHGMVVAEDDAIWIQVDGQTWNRVDPARAAAFMDRVREARPS